MATITKRIEVCDVCRVVDLPITRFRIAVGSGRLRTYALCEGDAKPLVSTLVSLGSGATGTTPPRRVGKTISMEQLADVKASRATAPTTSPVKGVRAQRKAPQARGAKGAGLTFSEG